VVKNIRQTLEERSKSHDASAKDVNAQEDRAQKASIREMVEVGRYLQARRLHMVSWTLSVFVIVTHSIKLILLAQQMLVERYNAGVNMTQEERARLSARRVGLK
jgi:hypothetical protein